MNISYKELFQKIRVNFLFNHPFLSVLALSIAHNFQQNAKSAFQTNGSEISIDEQKLSAYESDEITYLYAHTLLHIVLKHPYRQKTRDSYIWNQSCDIVINNILSTFSNIGEAPKDELIDESLSSKCVEEVYEVLYKESEEQNSDSTSSESKEQNAKVIEDEKGDLKTHKYDESKLDIEEVEDEKTSSGDREKIDAIIIQALSIASRSSNAYVGLQIEIDTLIKPEINLQDALKEFLISSLFEKTLTYERPNRRYMNSGIYLPGSKKKDELIELYIALDSSSSVSLDEYKKFLGVISDVCEGFYEYKITVLPFDLKVKSEHIVSFDSFNPLNDDEIFIPKSDGGTDFDEVLRYLKKSSDIRADNLLMVLSDGEFEISEALVSQTLFIVSDKKNIQKLQGYGRVIEFSI
ncbi:MAG: VWA-like domain-containing protein [Campylobacterota bacterium]|nr:VWA-like domain-containing protein [Campylobacterota bacterium]